MPAEFSNIHATFSHFFFKTNKTETGKQGRDSWCQISDFKLRDSLKSFSYDMPATLMSLNRDCTVQDQTSNPESTNNEFISKNLQVFFYLSKAFFCLRMKIDRYIHEWKKSQFREMNSEFIDSGLGVWFDQQNINKQIILLIFIFYRYFGYGQQTLDLERATFAIVLTAKLPKMKWFWTLDITDSTVLFVTMIFVWLVPIGWFARNKMVRKLWGL